MTIAMEGTNGQDGAEASGSIGSDLIPITSEMVQAGVDRWREFRFGQDEHAVIEAVYLAMELERRAQGEISDNNASSQTK